MKCACPHCKKVYEVDNNALGANYLCEKCGTKFFVPQSSTRICPDCGTTVSAYALSCPTCGRHRLYTMWIFLTFLLFISSVLGLIMLAIMLLAKIAG